MGTTSSNPRLSLAVELFKTLVAPIFMVTTGLGVFVYEAISGHDAAFASLSLALAATGAGLGADLLTKKVGG